MKSKERDHLTPQFVQLFHTFIAQYNDTTQDTNVTTILHNLKLVVQHNNHDLQVTYLRKCAEPFVKLNQQQNQQFQTDFIRLLVDILFCNEQRTIHKHIQFILNQFVAYKDADYRSSIVEQFETRVSQFMESAFRVESTYEVVDAELHTLDALWELNSLFSSVLDNLVLPYFIRANRSLKYHMALVQSTQSINTQKSLLLITAFCKLTLEIMKTKASIFKAAMFENQHPELLDCLKDIVNNSMPKILANENFTRDGSRVACLFIYHLLEMTFEGKNAEQIVTFFADTLFSDQPASSQLTTTDLFTSIILEHNVETMKAFLATFSQISFIAALGSLFNVFDKGITMQNIQSHSSQVHFALDLIIPALIDICSAKNSREQLFAIQVLYNATLELKINLQYLNKNKLPIVNSEKYEREIGRILNIVWDNWENSTHNIYDKMRDQFVVLLEIHDLLVSSDGGGGSGLNLESMTKQLLDLDFNRKGKYHPLINLLPRVGSAKFLELCPDLLERILSVIGNSMVNTQASVLFELVANDIFALHNINRKSPQSDALKQVQTQIFSPISKFLLGEGETIQESNQSHMLIYVVPKSLKSHPSNFSFLLQKVQEKSKGGDYQYSDLYLSAVIQLLIIGKSESLTNVAQEIQSNIDIIEICFKHFDPKLRLDALHLVTMSVRTTEICSKWEMEMTLEFIRSNLKPPGQAFRNTLSSIMKKFIVRITTSCYAIWNKLDKTIREDSATWQKVMSSLEQNQTVDAQKEVISIANMLMFIKRMIVLLQKSMYGGVPHDKLLTALSLYELIYSNLYKQPFLLIVYGDLSWLHSPRFLTQLLNQFVSCWDKVRSIIFNLILLMQDNEYLRDNSFVTHLIKRSLELNTSGRLRESDAGALLLNFVFAKFVVQKKMLIEWSYDNKDNQVVINISGPSDNSVLSFLNNLLKDLEMRVQNIETDIMRICLDSPVTGTLLAMRYTFDAFTLSKSINDENRSSWREFAQNLLRVSTNLMEQTLKMVGRAKLVDCRGHIQMNNNPLAHNLTVNSWLSIKETCALIGSFIQHAPLTNTNPILTEQQLSELGDLFIKILLHSKHNGAIEKAHVGFAMVCEALLRCELPNIAQLPSKWLQFTLDNIATSDDKNSILRRSAGVPFCIMAILKSEPEGVPRVLLPHTLQFLFRITDSYYEGKCGEHTMVHAVNVLRVIFQCGEVAADITHFIERGFITVLKGFTSTSWYVKNSSLMCYTALLQRSIGQKRTKSDSATQNTVTSREFFVRYPLLKDTLATLLATAIDDSQSSELHPNLYPSLLLLSRLRASSIIDKKFSDAGDVSQFIPLVTKCGALKHYLIRTMAARALIPLVTCGSTSNFVMDLLQSLTVASQSRNENHVHGILLQIHQFAMTIDELVDSSVARDWMSAFFTTIQSTQLLEKGRKYSFVSRTVVFEILNTLLVKSALASSVDTEMLLKLIELATTRYIYKVIGENEFAGVGFVEVQAEAARFALNAMLLVSQTQQELIYDILKLIECCVDHRNEKVRISVFQFISQLTEQHYDSSLFTMNDNHLFRYVLNHVLYNEPEHSVNSIRFGLESLQKISTLKTKQFNFTSSILLSEEIIGRVVEMHATTQNSYIKEQSVMLLGSFIPYTKNQSVVEQWTQFIDEDSLAYQPDSLRSACQHSIQHSQILQSNSIASKHLIFTVWTVCIRLMQDEEDFIRQATTAMLSPEKKLQVDAVLQEAFITLSAQFHNCDFYSEFLMRLVSLEEDETGAVVLPFAEELTDVPALFDREMDNLFQEELFAIQLAVSHIRKLTLSDSTRLQYSQSLLKQLEYVVNVIQNPGQLFFIGDVSYHPGVFLTLYRLTAGLLSLGASETTRDRIRDLLSTYDNSLLRQLVVVSTTTSGDDDSQDLFFILRSNNRD